MAEFYADEHEVRRKNPELLPARTKRDARLKIHIAGLWREQYEVYGVRKFWKEMKHQGFDDFICVAFVIDVRRPARFQLDENGSRG